jgi:energy-coupling factor transporter ATP-binding protein EcfA2
MHAPDAPLDPPVGDAPRTDFVRLRSLTILGLFGLFDHHLTLDGSNRILIIYGPNGVGKTTILRMVAHLFEGNFHYLRKVDFKLLAVELTDDSRLEITKNAEDVLEDSEDEDSPPERVPDLALSLRDPAGETREFPAPRFEVDRPLQFKLSDLERFLPVRRVGRLWRDLRTSELIPLVEVAKRFGDEFPPLRVSAHTPADLEAFLKKLPVHLIETQRLLSLPVRPSGRSQMHGSEEQTSTVMRFSHDLSTRIQRELARSAQLSQQLDRSFPSRLLDQELPASATEDQIRNRYAVQEKYRGRLIEAGLLDSADEVALPPRELGDIERRVLWAYLHDVEQKLGVFSPLLAKIEVLRDIINSRFLFKHLHTDKNTGFRFETDQDREVSPDSLSSGEQHELVLAYQLLFMVRPGSLVLIDEPEISFHVSWQQKFLQDLERISETADLDFLIATHSPQIIHDRWDLTISLSTEHA